jgi:hypothetical protein
MLLSQDGVHRWRNTMEAPLARLWEGRVVVVAVLLVAVLWLLVR